MHKPIRFNAFQMNTVSHQSPGLWTHPRDTGHRYTDPDYWTELARLLEAGRFEAILLADALGAYDLYQGSADAALRHAVQAPLNDPLALVPLMAQVTRHLGFGVSCALTGEHPYPFARRMSTLDHLTRGRLGWHIVTANLDNAARNLGLERQPGQDERYALADEYMDVVYKLWERSWDDDAVLNDKMGGVYADPARVHAIGHAGRYFKVPGFHLCQPSPQRTPLLYHDGSAGRGTAFAARHAEVAFVSGRSQQIVAKHAEQLRAAVRATGRDGKALKIYAQALIITAPSAAAAQAKYDDYRNYIDIEAALVLLSGWTGVDFSPFPLDARIDQIASAAGRSALASFGQDDPARHWTVRDTAQSIGLGGRGPVLVGDPVQIADQLEQWLDDTGIDGFNLTCALAHDSMRDVVELVVPELQRRGRYRTEYEDGTLRHQVFGRGARLAPAHVGRHASIGAQ